MHVFHNPCSAFLRISCIELIPDAFNTCSIDLADNDLVVGSHRFFGGVFIEMMEMMAITSSELSALLVLLPVDLLGTRYQGNRRGHSLQQLKI